MKKVRESLSGRKLMKLFTDVKIGHRLGIGFGITLALMGVIAVSGVVYLSGIKSNVRYIADVSSVRLKHAGDVRTSLRDLSFLIGEIVTSQDSSVKETARNKIQEIRAGYKKALDEVERLEPDQEGRELVAKLKDQVAKGREANDRLIEAAMAGKETEEGFQGLAATTAAYLQAADELVRYNEGRIKVGYEEAEGHASTARMVSLIAGIITLLVGVWLSRAITRSITIPIVRSAAHIDLMAKGDFSIAVSEHALKRKDEMGVFARSMDVMNTSLKQMLKEVTASAANVASASTQLTMSAGKLSKGATEQVEKTTVAATASAQMDQASGDIARSSTQVATSATEAVKVAEEGRHVVDKSIQEVNLIAETVETALGFVRELGEQSAKIGDIVTVINDIADQTNLLALNAAIEAARAGEHGRGFAVVADEVRKLAERSSTSTTEIANMIHSIREGVRKTVASMDTAKDKVGAGVEYSSQVSTALEGIVESINHLHSDIHQIATATEEMSATTDEIARDINQISAVTQETFSSSEEVSRAAAGLSDLSRRLEGSVQSFKV
jgi:methyl-accepting chemotaxis protein